MNNLTVNINDININITDYHGLLHQISSALDNKGRLCIAYTNANSINTSYKLPDLKKYLGKFDIVHPDGIGIKFAANFLYRGSYRGHRFTGSDLYPLLMNELIKHNSKVFFFGNTDEVLGRIAGNNHGLQVAGQHNGYSFDDENVISQINRSQAEILVVGLGTPLQERWTAKNMERISCNLIICVGDGISVIAGTRQRGPAFLRVIGLEWLYRLLSSPLKYFKRYVIGNPLFLYRIITLKMRKLAG